MASVHMYIGIEDINLNNAQRQQFWSRLKSLGQVNTSPYPHLRNHFRVSLDGRKIIVEAVFDKAKLTTAHFKNWLGSIFSIDLNTINHSSQQHTFSTIPTPIITFSRGATDYIRFAAFGGVPVTWPDSRIETLAYIKANQSDWDPPEP